MSLSSLRSEINGWQVITIYILLMTGVLQMLSHSRRWLGPPLVASQQWQMREAVQWRRSANTGKQRLQAFCVLNFCFGGCVSVLQVVLYIHICLPVPIMVYYLHFVQALSSCQPLLLGPRTRELEIFDGNHLCCLKVQYPKLVRELTCTAICLSILRQYFRL